MGKKKSQKKKAEGSQQQQQQAQQQQPTPPQPMPGSSGDQGTSQSATSKGKNNKKHSEVLQQQLQKQTEQAHQQPHSSLEEKQDVRVQHDLQQRGPPSEQERRSQQSIPSLQPQQPGSRERGSDQHHLQQAAPSAQRSLGAWQKKPQLDQPPQRQQPSSLYLPSPVSQKQAASSQDWRRSSQQTTPQQPGPREPAKESNWRERGRGWQQPQAQPDDRQRGPSQSHQQPLQRQSQQQRHQHLQEQPQHHVTAPPQRQHQVKSPLQEQQQPQGVHQTAQRAWQRGQQKQASQQLRQPSVQQPQSQQTSQKTAGDASQISVPKQPRSQPPQKASGQEQPTTSHESSPPLDLVIPRRKKLQSGGTAGKKIIIETNHLALILRKLEPVVHYDVTIEPDKPKRFLRNVMEAFRKIYYPNRHPAFDGVKNLYSPTELPFGEHIDGEVTIEEDERPKNFKVTINFAAMVDLSVLSKHFESDGEEEHVAINTQKAIQCLDVALRSAPALRLIPVGRSFFTTPRNIIDLGEGMQMYYGFYQSAVLGWNAFLNVDVSHKAFPKSLRVIDLIGELCPRCDINGRLSPRDFTTVDKFVRTLKVQYVIPNNPTSRRVMRVNQLDRPASETRFRLDNGQETTVEQYFKKEKGYRLNYPNMPCLWMGNRKSELRMLFPVELCTIVEGQVTNRSMTPNQTSAMIKRATTSTNVRKERIMEAIKKAGFNQNESAREFGISVNENFLTVAARVLDAPTLSYANRVVRPQKGVWQSDKFRDGKSLQNWCILCVDDRTRPQALQVFADMMVQQGQPLGMQIAKPTILPPVVLTYRKEKQELEQQFKKLKEMQLILVVISNIQDIYYYVKQAAELSVGTLTQCVRGCNIFRPNPSTVKNILLKVNAKLNGVNYILQERPRCLDLEEQGMIMGADVTHPSPEKKETEPSVAAVTASHDLNAFQYNICWRLQKSGQEIILDLANIVQEHLRFFYEKNKRYPKRIIFFRDGVSEGQFQAVLNAEVHAIRQACITVQKDGMYKPKITFLVVQKRHHTRFFPTNQHDCDDKRNFNVPAGTVVDTDITHPTALDFYLVSHASIQGVARPTKYRMLWDENDMSENELEQLTYHLCHMFTRCTRSVSYPAPTYYAHLAAARAKVYCEKRSIDLNNLQREQERLTIKSEIVKGLPMYFV